MEHLARDVQVFRGIGYRQTGRRQHVLPQKRPRVAWPPRRRPISRDLIVRVRKAQGKTPVFASPLALEAVRRIDAVFDVERGTNARPAAERRAVRQEISQPLVAELEGWMRHQRVKLSRHDDVAKAIDYMFKRWASFTHFLEDGRVCTTNNAAERALRGIVLAASHGCSRAQIAVAKGPP